MVEKRSILTLAQRCWWGWCVRAMKEYEAVVQSTEKVFICNLSVVRMKNGTKDMEWLKHVLIAVESRDGVEGQTYCHLHSCNHSLLWIRTDDGELSSWRFEGGSGD